MKKRFLTVLIAIAIIFTLAACGPKEEPEKYPGLTALTESAIALAEQYNELAQKAIDNGWEQDFETLKLMNDIADRIDVISEKIQNPEAMVQGEIEKLTEEVAGYATTLTEDIAEKVSGKFN